MLESGPGAGRPAACSARARAGPHGHTEMSDAPASSEAADSGSAAPRPGAKARVRIKKRRVLAVGIPLLALAGISLVFGMMMAVAADLPALEQIPQVAKSKNSILYDVQKRPLTTLRSNDGRVLVSSRQISPNLKNAVIAIEDERFYSNAGVDLQGIARAFYQDVIKGGAVQGGSTITQQFIKYARRAQNDRTLFEKAREAALAFHMTRNWSKDKILTEYLNSIYFGNGAYGIEAAAKTYFGSVPANAGCSPRKSRACASLLTPAESAMLAAIIASPSAFDPIAHPVAAKQRRDVVLRKMLEQGKIGVAEYRSAVLEPVPSQLTLPRLETPEGSEYFVTWVRQSLVDRVGARRAFEGNLRVRTTLDLDMQKAAERAVQSQLSWSGGPSAAVVVIDNSSGEVRAMVGGRDYNDRPFNLATQGQRQPGSSIKPFILAEALARGYSPGRTYPSRKREFKVPNGGGEYFVVNNFDNKYLGSASIADALTFSDNSVFAALGIELGTKSVAARAKRMGIRTPISTNYAMTLGGLEQGVTPLDMAHAYETFATGGNRIEGTLGTANGGPVAIDSISKVDGDGKLVLIERNKRRTERALSAGAAQTATTLLTGPVRSGSARRAQYGGFAAGKTGTTENSGDAWFVGFTERFTIAVWVGYPDGLKPMLTEFGGDEVTGGTFPALIWRAFVLEANRILDARRAKRDRDAAGDGGDGDTTTEPLPGEGGAPADGSPTSTEPSTDTPASRDGTGQDSPAPKEAPASKTPATPKPAPAPAPSPAPAAPSGGTGTGGGAAAPTG